MHLDLTKKGDTSIFCVTRRCGVLCPWCDWRGYRQLKFLMNDRQRFDVVRLTSQIEYMRAHKKCPKCNSGCVFTHVTGSSFVV